MWYYRFEVAVVGHNLLSKCRFSDSVQGIHIRMCFHFPSLSVCGCRERALTHKMEGKHSDQMELDCIRSGTCWEVILEERQQTAALWQSQHPGQVAVKEGSREPQRRRRPLSGGLLPQPTAILAQACAVWLAVCCTVAESSDGGCRKPLKIKIKNTCMIMMSAHC